jgi:DNA-directed RNA polymerase subunit F
MKVKKVLSEKVISLPELREILISIRDQRSGGDEETEGAARTMSYELRKSIDHADSLGKCPRETAEKIVEELLGLEKIKPEIAYRIVNIMPESRDEIRAIYAKERFTLLPEDMDQILDILRKYM